MGRIVKGFWDKSIDGAIGIYFIRCEYGVSGLQGGKNILYVAPNLPCQAVWKDADSCVISIFFEFLILFASYILGEQNVKKNN